MSGGGLSPLPDLTQGAIVPPSTGDRQERFRVPHGNNNSRLKSRYRVDGLPPIRWTLQRCYSQSRTLYDTPRGRFQRV